MEKLHLLPKRAQVTIDPVPHLLPVNQERQEDSLENYKTNSHKIAHRHPDQLSLPPLEMARQIYGGNADTLNHLLG